MTAYLFPDMTPTKAERVAELRARGDQQTSKYRFVLRAVVDLRTDDCDRCQQDPEDCAWVPWWVCEAERAGVRRMGVDGVVEAMRAHVGEGFDEALARSVLEECDGNG